jgi:hypothetical protein
MNAQYRAAVGKPENVVRKVIKDAEDEEVRIATYIRDAETALRPN